MKGAICEVAQHMQCQSACGIYALDPSARPRREVTEAWARVSCVRAEGGCNAVLICSNGTDFAAMMEKMNLVPHFVKLSIGELTSWGNILLKPRLQDLEAVKELMESYGRRVEVTTAD